MSFVVRQPGLLPCQEIWTSYRSNLKEFVLLGEEMLIDLSLRDAPVDAEQKEVAERIKGCFERKYQRWYTEACAAVGQLIPGRQPNSSSSTWATGSESDRRRHLQHSGLAHRPRSPAAAGEDIFDDRLAVSLRLKTQLEILKSAEARFQSSLFEMRQLVRADLFDSELDACRELAAHGFLRAAGAIAGVILENTCGRSSPIAASSCGKRSPRSTTSTTT